MSCPLNPKPKFCLRVLADVVAISPLRDSFSIRLLGLVLWFHEILEYAIKILVRIIVSSDNDNTNDTSKNNICIHVYMYVHVYIYIYIYMYTWIDIHIQYRQTDRQTDRQIVFYTKHTIHNM